MGLAGVIAQPIEAGRIRETSRVFRHLTLESNPNFVHPCQPSISTKDFWIEQIDVCVGEQGKG